jgi:thioredoxin
MNAENFRQAIASGQPVLVEFQAPWCVYCRRIAPALSKVAAQREGSVLVAQINIDNEPELARQERIEVIPTLVVYKGGYDLGSIVAPESKARIDAFLNDVLEQ